MDTGRHSRPQVYRKAGRRSEVLRGAAQARFLPKRGQMTQPPMFYLGEGGKCFLSFASKGAVNQEVKSRALLRA